MIGYCDGACRVSNPGQCSCAFAVFAGEDLVSTGSRYLGPELYTNNVAEYLGLLDLLKWAYKNQVRGLEIFCDSKLVVEQSLMRWKVNTAELVPLVNTAHSMLIRGGHTLTHIKGHSGDPGNELVDKLCNIVLDKELGNGKA